MLLNIPNPTTYLPVYIQTLYSRTKKMWCFEPLFLLPGAFREIALVRAGNQHLKSLNFIKSFILSSSNFNEKPFDMWYAGILIAISYCTLDAKCQDLSMHTIYSSSLNENLTLFVFSSSLSQVPWEGWCHNLTIKKNNANTAIHLITNKGKILLIQFEQRSVWGPSHRTSRF